MATTSEGERPTVSNVLGARDATDRINPTSRRGRGSRWVLPAIVLIAVVGLTAVGAVMLAGSLGSSTGSQLLTHIVDKGELLITITEDGNLESANNKEIKCGVAGGSTILWIVEDGKMVKQDEELVRLDSSQLEEQINQQKIVHEKAKAAHIQAEKDHSVAKIAVQEYIEGTYNQELQDLEAQIKIAMENLRSAENSLQHTQRMFRKGYVSPLQREAQEFAVERAQLELDSANTAKNVLEKFTRAKMLEDLNSKRDTALARWNAEIASLDLEEARLGRLEAQLDKCVVLAPQDGMAVYANQTGRHRFGAQQPQIEEGAMVREQQSLFHLPDLSQMQARVTVHESKVDQLDRGMRARIRVQDRQYQGIVDSIANQPEPGGFFSANVK
ncbi:MAG: HlyD family efflux transporter periplasmic adaptor subunit, partial [bacterium]|nr:HlyD family efflux transporter periplasmic adaptor subunit [bacterium]